MKSGTVMGVVDESIVRRYIQYLRLERSYSKNTLDAYRRDLQKLLVYYADNNRSIVFLPWRRKLMPTQPNCLRVRA